MKILNIVPYVGNVSAGPSYSVPRLCGAVAAVPGMKLTLHTLAPLPAAREEWNFAVQAWPRHRFPHPALGRSPEMRRGLQEACQTADIIHNHSLWMLPNIYPEFVRRGTRCKLVISPRGCLGSLGAEPVAVEEVRQPDAGAICQPFPGRYAACHL